MPISITGTKSSLVLVGPSTAPAAAPTTGHINLSSFDKALVFFPVTSFHIFDHAIHRPTETVRRALSHALLHYFPVAGRVVDADGELCIACTGEGVAFVAATANHCSLDDVKLFDPPFDALLKELAVNLGANGFRRSDPLLLIQVTELSCGGFVVGVTRNHVIADGTGFAQFLQAVGELARGLPQPSVFPVSCGDDSLPELPPLVAAMEKTLVTLEPRHFAYLDITVRSRCINRIKAGFAGHADADEPYTVFESVMAVLWQCRTRAVMSDPETPAPLIFAANVRKHAGAKNGYYGNCITTAVVVPTSREVANGDVNDVVKLIKRAKHLIPYQFNKKKNAAAGEEGHRHGLELEGGVPMAEQQPSVMFGYNAFDVTSWQNLGSDAVDFGGGRPARVMCRMERMAVPHCVACLPCKKEGANVLARCVSEEHVEAFLGEVAKFT